MNGRSSVVATVVVFEWFNQLLEVELLVNLNEQVLLIDEVSESPAGELEQRGVSAEAVQWIEYRNPLLNLMLTPSCVPSVPATTGAFSTGPWRPPLTIGQPKSRVGLRATAMTETNATLLRDYLQ